MTWHVRYRIRNLSGIVSVGDEKSAMDHAQQLLASGASKVSVSYDSADAQVYIDVSRQNRPVSNLALSD